MGPLCTIAAKDLKLLVRDKAGFFFTFFFPLIIAVLFGSIFGSGGGGSSAMSVLIVDDDGTEISGKFIQTLQDASEIKLTASTLDSARQQVRTGKYVAYIRIKGGFSEAYQRLFYGDPPELEVGVDPSRRAESAMLQGILMKYGAKRYEDLFADKTMMRHNLERTRTSIEEDADLEGGVKENLIKLMGDLNRFYSDLPEDEISAGAADNGQTDGAADGGPEFTPLHVTTHDVQRIRQGPTNAYEVTFPQGMIWGIIGVAAAFGISIVVERTTGTLQRLRIAPIGIGHLLAGKALACMTATVAICTFLMIFGITIFNIKISSFLMVSAVIISVAIAFTGIMMLLSVLGRTVRSVSGIGWAVLLVMAMFGGGMIPMIFMPDWMLSLGGISPVKWAILAFEGAIWRGFTATEMLTPLSILIGTGVLAFIIGTLIFRRMEVH
ncbi:MAG: ABC-2 transporter permease [Acidobacteria bacterium]|nr:ABC-2 transporter permease [Acidobacteriota bacterium]